MCYNILQNYYRIINITLKLYYIQKKGIYMTLQQLKYIIEIVNCGSINLAASKLFITQPSLSKSVKELEAELGIEIFVRSNRGISLSTSGAEFLGYARQVVEQAELLEQRYMNKTPSKRLFSVSTQHYAFSVHAFVNMVKEFDQDEYEFAIRESKTHEIIEDVKNLRSEIGVIYLNDFNEKVLNKILKDNGLIFTHLFDARPHIFVSSNNPLAKKEKLTIEDLDPYPRVSFEQGTYNSFYFSEEILSTLSHKKNLLVSDRATLSNLLIGLQGYTITTGILSVELNGSNLVSIPLESNEVIRLGYIKNKNTSLSIPAKKYIEKLEDYIKEYQY